MDRSALAAQLADVRARIAGIDYRGQSAEAAQRQLEIQQGAAVRIAEAAGLVRIGADRELRAWERLAESLRSRHLSIPSAAECAIGRELDEFGEHVRWVTEHEGVRRWGDHALSVIDALMRELLAGPDDAGEGATAGPAQPAGSSIDDRAFVSEADLARLFNLNESQRRSLRRKLEEWRHRHHNNEWQRINNPGPRQSRYLYQYGAVRQVLDQMLNRPASVRPTKKDTGRSA